MPNYMTYYRNQNRATNSLPIKTPGYFHPMMQDSLSINCEMSMKSCNNLSLVLDHKHKLMHPLFSCTTLKNCQVRALVQTRLRFGHKNDLLNTNMKLQLNLSHIKGALSLVVQAESGYRYSQPRQPHYRDFNSRPYAHFRFFFHNDRLAFKTQLLVTLKKKKKLGV